MVETTSKTLVDGEIGWKFLPCGVLREMIKELREINESSPDTISFRAIEKLFERHGAVDTMWILGFGDKLSERFLMG